MERYWFLLYMFVISVTAQESPCPNLFRYVYEGDQWFGIIRIPATSFGTEIRLNLSMSLEAHLQPGQSGKIELIDSNNEVAKKIIHGGIITYRVLFPLAYPIPTINSIIINDVEYCPAYSEESTVNKSSVRLNLYHAISAKRKNSNPNTAFTSYDNYQTTTNFESSTTTPRIITTTRRTTAVIPKTSPTTSTTSKTTTSKITTSTTPKTTTKTSAPLQHQPQSGNENENKQSKTENYKECGKSSVVTNSLITGGEVTNPGDWPWLVALYHNDKKNSLKFICSGSLISENHIITAAHCLVTRNNRKPIEVLAKLGIHNIFSWTEPNQKIVQVTQSTVHPQYDTKFHFHDIAILKISSIEYTEFIKPICLWTGERSLDHVVGLQGTVVGWGKDENNNRVAPVPLKAKATIVSTDKCRNEVPALIEFTTDKTLCAGNRDGTGPCNGDSGGGLFVYKNGHWILRGIVSNSLLGADGEACGNRDYVVYTDSAKYLDWIKDTTS